MADRDRKNGLERVAFLRVHGVLPKRYHMKCRSGQGQMVYYHDECSRKKRFLMRLCTLAVVFLAVFGGVAWKNSTLDQNLHGIRRIMTYEDLYQYYQESIYLQQKELSRNLSKWGTGMGDVSSDTINGTSMAACQESGEVLSYLDPELREKGSADADCSVTDGQYLYTLSYSAKKWEHFVTAYHLTVTAYELHAGELKFVSEIEEDYAGMTYGSLPSLCLFEGTLVLVYTEFTVEDGSRTDTNIVFYDIDQGMLDFSHREVQSGDCRVCRQVDGNLCVISHTSPIMKSDLKKTETYIPMRNGEPMAPEDIYMLKETQGNAYEIISIWSSQGSLLDTKVLVGRYENIYMSANNLYLCGNHYANITKKESCDQIQIVKLSCENGEIQWIADTVFPGTQQLGTRQDNFAIQETGGTLWVTTEAQHYVYQEDGQENHWTEGRVYTFDENLEELDHLDGLMKNKMIHGVKYVGSIGYIEPYPKEKSLLCVDFSDPRHLKVLDGLVLSDFPSYFHPVQDDLLLGLGQTNDHQLKLSLYDISDPGKLISIQEIEFEEDVSSCSALWDYRWVLVDRENQLIGFYASDWDDISNPTWKNRRESYYLYHYDRENGLQLAKKIEWKGKTSGFWKGYRVGSYLYLATQRGKESNLRVESLDGLIDMKK